MCWLRAPHHIENLSFECHHWVATLLLVLGFLPFFPKLCGKWNTKLITVQSINVWFLLLMGRIWFFLFILMNVWAFWQAFTLGSWKYSIASVSIYHPQWIAPFNSWLRIGKSLLTQTCQMNVWFFQVRSRRKLMERLCRLVRIDLIV